MKKRLIYILCAVLVSCIAWAAAVHFSVAALVSSLRRDHVSVSISAEVVRAIPGGKRAALPALLTALEDANYRVRWQAGDVLASFCRPDPTRVVPELLKLLQHEQQGVRWNAAYLLGEMHVPMDSVIAALVAAMQEDHAGEVLSNGGAAWGSRRYDIHKEFTVRSAAAEALGKFGAIARPAVAALIKQLADPNRYVRVDSAMALWKIERNAESTVPALTEILTKTPPEKQHDLLRVAAAESLGEIGPDALAAVPALIGALQQGRGDARDEAARALGKIGPTARSAIPPLARALDDDAPFFRLEVAEALARIGDPPSQAVWALVDILKDQSNPPFAHTQAIRILQLLGPKSDSAIPALIETKVSAGNYETEAAVLALAELNPDALRNPRARLNADVESTDAYVRVTAAEALWKLSGERDRPIRILIEALSVPETLPRRWAARALGDAKPADAPLLMPVLTEKLKDPDIQVRVFVAEAIWNIAAETKVAIPTLIEILKNPENPERARSRAAYALGRIGRAAEEAIPVLRVASADEQHWDTHVAATRALELIDPEAERAAAAMNSGNQPRLLPIYPAR